jgi:hypothetical protein
LQRTNTAAVLGSDSECSPNATESPFTSASTKFIAGEPMKPAARMFAGSRNSLRGVSHCWSTPSRMNATRWPSVTASTWSCVTSAIAME